MLEITADFTMADIDKDIKIFINDIEVDITTALSGTIKSLANRPTFTHSAKSKQIQFSVFCANFCYNIILIRIQWGSQG
jgi:hypothetical protein